MNGVLDEDGCPDKALKKFSGTIRGIKFAFNSDIIDLISYPILEEAAEVMKNHGGESIMIVEGHTDSIGSTKYNKTLSRKRAESVRQYLISKGVSPFKLKIAPYGESRPIASNKTETGRALNRRIEFKFKLPEAK